MKKSIVFCIVLFTISIAAQKPIFSKEDSLRGSNTSYRNWWNVVYYDIDIEPDFEQKTIKGTVIMYFKITKEVTNQELQIDLQFPLVIDKIEMIGMYSDSYFNLKKRNNVFDLKTFGVETLQSFPNLRMIKPESHLIINNIYAAHIQFHGALPIAKSPPWDGGWVFSKDANGNPWITAACEGDGASIWFPCKDYNGDEPDFGMQITSTVPKDMVFVSNGKLLETKNKNKTTWYVQNPINLYNIIPYYGKYAHISDSYSGLKGRLSLDYYVLEYNKVKAKKQFQHVKKMLHSFEDWFGPYPFYEDGYKIVETSHLGMEHQSAIAYGNDYKNGYCRNGKCLDWSNTGIGFLWDFIIIHESGHEWFGNSISANEVADLWIHEAFTSYSETLFTESYFGKEKANQYVIGTRRAIQNDIPIVGKYGVNVSGSTDMYFKGANVIHTLRQLLEDDVKFKTILRKMNTEWYHKTVTGKQIEDFWSAETGIDLHEFFDQYLRTTQVPKLVYYTEHDTLYFKYENVIDKFDMPLLLNSGEWIYPNGKEWKSIQLKNGQFSGVNPNLYVETSAITKPY